MIVKCFLFISFLYLNLFAQAPIMPPTPVVAPVSVEQVVTPPVTTSEQPPVVASAPQPTVASVPGAVAYEKDFEELNQNLNEAVNTKKTLKDIVKDINDKLMDARKKVIETQKIGFEIMQKTQAEAEPMIVQASSDLQKLQDLQKSVQTELLPKFEGSAKKIEDIIKKAQDKMAELQAKGLKFQAAQLQQEAGAQQKTEEKSTTSTSVAPTEVASIGVAPQAQEKSFYHNVWNGATSVVATSISYIQSGWKTFRNWALGSGSDVKKNLKSIGSVPNLTFNVPDKEDKITDSFKAAQAHLAACEAIVKDIENSLNSTYQKYLVFKIKIAAIEKMLLSNSEFQEYVQKFEEIDPMWKRVMVQGFSQALDVVFVLYSAAKKIAVGVYDYLFSGFLSKFVSDVKDKIKKKTEKESNEEKPAMSAMPIQK
jgi:hypothetical protein